MDLLFIITVLFVTSTHPSDQSPLQGDAALIKNKQFSFTKSKYIDCGSTLIDEHQQEDENIDQQLILNLTSCLNEKHPNPSTQISFSTHLSTKIDQIFTNYFNLDTTTGSVNFKKALDREHICTRSSKLKRKASLNEDSLDCDCRSDKCELRLKFNAFRDYLKKTNHYHLIYTIKINDLNDNLPKFKTNYLYLNISEFIGTNNLPLNERQPEQTLICPFTSRLKRESKNINDEFLISNTLLPLETNAIDLDSDKYAEIKYDLVLLKSKSCDLIQSIESQQTESFREYLIKAELIDSLVNDCNNEFELVEASLNDVIPTVSLFLKVNKYLDREVQDCYNFILMATDKNRTITILSNEIKLSNYMLIKLALTDLNDNLPHFEQSKYLFNLNETTEFSTEYNEHYFNQLKETCSNLKAQLKVKAFDSDLDLNGQISYKIIQQVHRKNPGYKTNINRILTEDNYDQLDSQSIFTIDKHKGLIYLKICDDLAIKQPVSRLKYLEYMILLDFELYVKHILVIEASDSSAYNPLQSFVTVEINILDLNDQAPTLISLYSSDCSIRDHNSKLDISIQDYKLNKSPWLIKNYSSKLIINGVSEWSRKGSCLGQFLITDLDTAKTNRKLEAFLVDHDDNTRLANEFLFKNYKLNQEINTASLMAQHEIFELFLNFDPDAETQRDYKYTLLLRDHGNLTPLVSLVEVIILIKDENDNKPSFEQNSYQFKLDEWFHNPDYDYEESLSNLMSKTVINHCFGKVEAFDLDQSNTSSSISYQFVNLDPFDQDLFYYNVTSCQVCVKNRTLLDRELKNIYSFQLYAINDLATVKLNSSVQIDVILNDLNDNRPQFPVREYSFFVPETDSNLINSLLISSDRNKMSKRPVWPPKTLMNFVGQISASDKDVNLNADLIYYIKTTGEDNLFEFNMKNLDSSESDYKSQKYQSVKNMNEIIYVNATSGKIYLLKGIDREQITHLRFNLYVSDRRGSKQTGWPNEPLTNMVPVSIEFIDINDSKPQCSNLDLLPSMEQNYQIFIYSIYFNLLAFKQFESHSIYNFYCTDNDLAKNAELLYELADLNLKQIDSAEADNELNKTDLILSGNLFDLDSQLGVLNLNFNQEWFVTYNETSNVINPVFMNIFNNYFFVLKFKVSDNGMIPSYSYYTLKLRFCFNNTLKYCESDSFNNSNMPNFIMQRLTNVDEEFFTLHDNAIATMTTNSQENEFSSKESDDFEDVSFINEEDRLMNDFLINNRTALKNTHPYPISYSSTSYACCLKFNFISFFKCFFVFLIYQWLFIT